MDTRSNTPQDLTAIVSANLKRLIAQNGTTQKELAEQLGIAAASMTDYCKGRRLPGAEVLVSLKELYGISIDEFLTRNISPAAAPQLPKEPAFDLSIRSACLKYCGVYYVYYFDTSKYKGRDTQPPKDALTYGVLLIYEDLDAVSSSGISGFRTAAVLGIRDRASVLLVRKTLDSLSGHAEIRACLNQNYSATAYYGDFDLSPEHAFISMRHANTDRMLAIFHRVDSNKDSYAGGIGTVNSVSKGRERMPVVQFLGISRDLLSISAEEIHHSLLLNYPDFHAEAETEEMIRSFKALYVDADEGASDFTEYQKTIMVRSTLERFIRKSLERNVFRYGKISESDDDEWYHFIRN